MRSAARKDMVEFLGKVFNKVAEVPSMKRHHHAAEVEEDIAA